MKAFIYVWAGYVLWCLGWVAWGISVKNWWEVGIQAIFAIFGFFMFKRAIDDNQYWY
jgi:hypothetical protein